MFINIVLRYVTAPLGEKERLPHNVLVGKPKVQRRINTNIK